MIRPPLRLMQAAFVAACIVAFAVATWPDPLKIEGEGGDKYLHFATFYFLELLALVTARRRRWIPAIGLVVMGGLIEVVQGMVGRDRSVWDLLADTLGVAAAVLPWALAHRWPDLRKTATESEVRPGVMMVKSDGAADVVASVGVQAP